MRLDGLNVLIVSQWADPRDNDVNIAWCRGTFEALTPYFARFRYVNYLDQDEEGDPAAAVYGPNLARLRRIKAQYDPDNFFHFNVNIKPAQGAG